MKVVIAEDQVVRVVLLSNNYLPKVISSGYPVWVIGINVVSICVLGGEKTSKASESGHSPEEIVRKRPSVPKGLVGNSHKLVAQPLAEGLAGEDDIVLEEESSLLIDDLIDHDVSNDIQLGIS